MGRYYHGDIEGKFWFGVQSSGAAERFGCVEAIPNVIDYYADEDHLPSVNEELKNIEDKMGDQLAKYQEFFEKRGVYSDQKLIDAGLDIALLEDFADYLLGIKIRDCIMEQGSCSFTAEL